MVSIHNFIFTLGFQLGAKSESQIVKDMFEELLETYDCLASGFTKLLQLLNSIEDFLSVEQAKLKESKTTSDIFEMLQNYWDFVNYHLLKFILEHSGNENLQRKMETYVSLIYQLTLYS